MLLALDSADPPAEHDGMYPRGALLAANYSVPILWLSLFGTDGLVIWPGIHGSTFTAVVQPRSECIERSRARLGEWSRRCPDVFGDMSEPWLSYLRVVERPYLAVWAEELSWMADSDQTWAAELRGYLSCLDDSGSAVFHEALAQSYLYSDGSQRRVSPRHRTCRYGKSPGRWSQSASPMCGPRAVTLCTGTGRGAVAVIPQHGIVKRGTLTSIPPSAIAAMVRSAAA